jgi:hypothetical protein
MPSILLLFHHPCVGYSGEREWSGQFEIDGGCQEDRHIDEMWPSCVFVKARSGALELRSQTLYT